MARKSRQIEYVQGVQVNLSTPQQELSFVQQAEGQNKREKRTALRKKEKIQA